MQGVGGQITELFLTHVKKLWKTPYFLGIKSENYLSENDLKWLLAPKFEKRASTSSRGSGRKFISNSKLGF